METLCFQEGHYPYSSTNTRGQGSTVTDKKMTRFLMSLNATELVMHAINNGKNGDLFIHKVKSAYIYDLAKACLLITNSKNKIKIIGIRAGEN